MATDYKNVIKVALEMKEPRYATIHDLRVGYFTQAMVFDTESDNALKEGFEQFCKDNNLTPEMTLQEAFEKLQ